MDLFLYHKTKTFFRNKSLMLRSLGIIFTGLIVFYLRCKAMNFTQPKFQPADNPASFAGNKLIRVS